MQGAGITCQIVGTLLLAAHVEYSWVAYWIMLVGSIMLIEAEHRRRCWSCATMWIFFTAANVFGIGRWTPWS